MGDKALAKAGKSSVATRSGAGDIPAAAPGPASEPAAAPGSQAQFQNEYAAAPPSQARNPAVQTEEELIRQAMRMSMGERGREVLSPLINTRRTVRRFPCWNQEAGGSDGVQCGLVCLQQA